MCLAIPGKIVELDPDAAASGNGRSCRRAAQGGPGLLKDDMPVTGDWVLIHVGFAMTKISEQDAVEQMHLLRCWARRSRPCRKFGAMVLKRVANMGGESLQAQLTAS